MFNKSYISMLNISIFYTTCIFFIYNIFAKSLLKLNSILLSYLYSSVHSIIITYFALSYLTNRNNLSYEYFISIPIGYCIVDICVILIDNELRKKMPYSVYVHHFLLIYCLYNSLSINNFYENDYDYSAAIALLSEFTNIFLNNAWFMKNYNLIDKYKTTFMINGLLLIILYFFLRVINFSYIIYISFNHGEYWLVILSTILTIMNVNWFLLIVKNVSNKL